MKKLFTLNENLISGREHFYGIGDEFLVKENLKEGDYFFPEFYDSEINKGHILTIGSVFTPDHFAGRKGRKVIFSTNRNLLGLPVLVIHQMCDAEELAERILDKHFPHSYYSPNGDFNAKKIHDNDCERCKYDDRILPSMLEFYKATRKEFTREDMENAIGNAFAAAVGFSSVRTYENDVKEFKKDYLNSLQQPQLIGVEVEMVETGWKCQICESNDKCKAVLENWRPKDCRAERTYKLPVNENNELIAKLNWK